MNAQPKERHATSTHSKGDETRVLARFAATLRYEDIPEKVRAKALDLLVDQLGVQIGCSELPWAQQVRATYSRAGGAPEATVVRYGERLPLVSAAFINSTFGHSFEYDDANTLAHGHAGAELIPALFAVAERDHVSGREFLTTLVAAYEVRGRIGWAVSPDISLQGGPQYSTSCGPFGAATGVARLLKLDAEGIRNAMAIAGTFSGGLMQYDHGGGSVKRIFTAVGASSGMQSALLAQAGMTGPERILEGERGLLKIYPANYRPERLVAEFGSKWTIEYATLKPYCCCAIIHPAIDATRELAQAHELKASDIEAIDVAYTTASSDHAAIPEPTDLLSLQFSTSYSLALTLLQGRNTPREYTLDVLKDETVRALASKVSVRADPDLNQYFEHHRPARVKIRSRGGQTFERFVLDARGSPGAPLAGPDVDAKFRSQVADVVGVARCDELLERLREIAAVDDVAKLTPALVKA